MWIKRPIDTLKIRNWDGKYHGDRVIHVYSPVTENALPCLLNASYTCQGKHRVYNTIRRFEKGFWLPLIVHGRHRLVCLFWCLIKLVQALTIGYKKHLEFSCLFYSSRAGEGRASDLVHRSSGPALAWSIKRHARWHSIDNITPESARGGSDGWSLVHISIPRTNPRRKSEGYHEWDLLEVKGGRL